MPTCTPTYRLPYIACSDRPCDQSETWCAFAEAVEIELDRLDSIVARTNTSIPMAKISASTSQPMDNVLLFDTVDEDTNNMVNLSESPSYIFPQRPGLYRARLYVEVGTTGSASSSFIIQLDAAQPVGSFIPILPAGNPILQIVDPNLVNSVSYSLEAFFRFTEPNSRIFGQVSIGSVAGTPTTVNRAELDAEWMAD